MYLIYYVGNKDLIIANELAIYLKMWLNRLIMKQCNVIKVRKGGPEAIDKPGTIYASFKW